MAHGAWGFTKKAGASLAGESQNMGQSSAKPDSVKLVYAYRASVMTIAKGVVSIYSHDRMINMDFAGDANAFTS